MDAEIEEALIAKSLICIEGPFQSGKSSLAARVREVLRSGYATSYVDLQGCRTDTESLLMNDFFDTLSGDLSTSVTSLMQLSKLGKPLAIIIDELGTLTQKTASFVEKLCYLGHTMGGQVRIIACFPTSAQHASVRAFMHSLNVQNQKYLTAFTIVRPQPFSQLQIGQLLSLLPSLARGIAGARIATLVARSQGAPSRLQFVCSKLWAAEANGADEAELTAIIESEASYE